MKPQWDYCCVDSINFRFDLCDLLEARVVIAVSKQCQGLALELGLKPQRWVLARRAVIPANYSQGPRHDFRR